MEKKENSIIIGWLYPELMSTYGDQGNVRIIMNRAKARGISAEMRVISLASQGSEIATADLLFMGGAQDQSQKIVADDLETKKEYLHKAIDHGVPGLYVCGAYQLLGQYYLTADKVSLKGLGIFDCHTENPGNKRMIGTSILEMDKKEFKDNRIIGFENHGGQTFLNTSEKSFGKVIKGFGNNGEDKTEGILHKNSIGTYLHGPILSKNPELADWLIKKALEIKYGSVISFEPIDDNFEQKARAVIFNRMGI